MWNGSLPICTCTVYFYLYIRILKNVCQLLYYHSKGTPLCWTVDMTIMDCSAYDRRTFKRIENTLVYVFCHWLKSTQNQKE